MVDFDSLVPDAEASPVQPGQPQVDPNQSGPMSFDSLVDDEEKYGTTEQMAKTAAEGLAKGFLGHTITGAVEKGLGVNEQDIKNREETNPILHGASEVAGLGAGLLSGVGPEAKLMDLAGEAAVHAAQLEAPISAVAKIGSEAVKQAAEMAMLSTDNQIHKALVSDTPFSAESAIADIGLNAALGGLGGAAIGSISPLWSATAGPKVESFLSGLKDHLNGDVKAVLPQEIEAATKTLGLEVDPTIRAGMSDNPLAQRVFNNQRELQNTEILSGINKLRTDVQESVLNSTGKTADDIANYSEAQQGHSGIDTFKKEFKDKFAPAEEKYQALKNEMKVFS
jgi:hypothetical protein